MAHKKGQSSSRNGRDSQPKMLGIKAFGGEFVTAGSIIVRQRGIVKFKKSLRKSVEVVALPPVVAPAEEAPGAEA